MKYLIPLLVFGWASATWAGPDKLTRCNYSASKSNNSLIKVSEIAGEGCSDVLCSHLISCEDKNGKVVSKQIVCRGNNGTCSKSVHACVAEAKKLGVKIDGI
jgi:hypothetical protein